LPLIGFGVAINASIGLITAALKIPLYLDSIGTVLVAALCGPWAGMLCGVTSNVMASALGNAMMIFFAPVSCLIGAFTALLARLGCFGRWYLAVPGGFVQGILAALVSAPIAALVSGGTMMAGTDALVMLFRGLGNSTLRSVFYQGLVSDPLDKALTYLFVFLILQNLPERILSRFPGPVQKKSE